MASEIKKMDWASHLKLNMKALRIMGLWPQEKTYKYDLYLMYAFIVFTSFIILHVSFQLINLYFMRDDLTVVAGTSYILLIKILSAFKGYHLVKNMGLLRQVLKILNDDLFQPRNQDQMGMLQTNISFWKLVQRFYFSTSYIANMFFAIYPLLDKSSEERRLPFLAWYPFDSKISPFYELTYTYQVLALVYNTSVHMHVDALICVFTMYASSEFELLSDNLRNLIEEIDTSLETSSKLMRCIQHHKLILDYLKKCNIFFNWIVFAQFFVSAGCIGITMFHLTLVTPFSNQFNSIFLYWTAVTVQIFLYCWFGNELQHKSSNVPYAVFESDWLHLPQKIKKVLIFFTLNLLKPVQLSALDLFFLTLETFMRIMKTAWSYFAFLHQMGSEKK